MSVQIINIFLHEGKFLKFSRFPVVMGVVRSSPFVWVTWKSASWLCPYSLFELHVLPFFLIVAAFERPQVIFFLLNSKTLCDFVTPVHEVQGNTFILSKQFSNIYSIKFRYILLKVVPYLISIWKPHLNMTWIITKCFIAMCVIGENYLFHILFYF